ncbi:MAG: hypothetical protein NZ853_04235 [Leptospiraceae bacterium]|nr:hypothetical protein [Leptospiraceae bacterium]MDW7975382.1 hypothetical protein [Leptospiraceae bacterium]
MKWLKANAFKILLGSLFVLLIFLYNFIVSAFFLNRFLKPYLAELFPDAVIEYHVNKVGLFTGIDVDNLKIFDKITNTSFIEVKKIKIDYFLLGILIGDIGIREISLVEPNIFLYQLDDRWNFESLIGKLPEEESPPQEEPLPEKISLYLPIKLYFLIKIQNLSFLYKKDQTIQKTKKTIESLQIQNLTLITGLVSKRFSEIPLNLKLLDLIDDVLIELNPQKEFSLEYQKSYAFSSNPIINLKLYKKEEPYTFHLNTQLQVKDLQIEKQKISTNTEFLIKIQYQPKENLYIIEQVSLQENQNYLLFLIGKFQYDQDNSFIEISQKANPHSKFSFENYSKILSFILDKPIRLGGNLSFEEINLQGHIKDIFGKLKLRSDYFYFEDYSVKNLFFGIEGKFDISSFFYSPPANQQETPSNLVLGFIKEIHYLVLKSQFLTSNITLTGNIYDNINTKLIIENFLLDTFTKPFLLGNASLELNGIIDKTIQNITLQAKLTGKELQYLFENSYSKKHHLELLASGMIHLLDLTKIFVDVERLLISDSAKQSILTLKGNSQMEFSSYQNILIDLKDLSFQFGVFEDNIPLSLKPQIQPLKGILKEGIFLKGKAELTFSQESQYRGNLSLLLPSLHPTEILIKTDIKQNPSKISFDELFLQGWDQNLILKTKGALVKKREWEPRLEILFQYQNYKTAEVYKNLFLRGNLLLEVDILGKQIQGNLFIRNFDVKYILPCDSPNKELCRFYEVQNVNLTLPFEHQLEEKFPVSFQKEEFFSLPQPNFVVQSIRSNYSIDNAYFKEGFYYLGSKNNKAIEGYLSYQKNILWIPYLRFSSFLKDQKNGDIELKNFYFNLSNLQPNHMELQGDLYIVNFDLNSLFPKAENVFKGILSGYAKIRTFNLQDFFTTTEMSVSVYQISKDFGGFLVRIIAPTIVASVVNNTLRINSIDLELKNGLVYTSIRVSSPGFFSLSRLIRPREEEIRQERIPLAEFIKRSEKEIQMELE